MIGPHRVGLGLMLVLVLCRGPAYADLATGLEPYYRLDGDATDSSGSGLHGTNQGAVATTDRFGAIDSALHFDGTNDFLDMGINDAWNFGSEPFTVSLWFKADGVSTRKLGMFTVHNAGADIEVSIGYGLTWSNAFQGGDKIGLGLNYIGANNWGADVMGTNALSDGNWHHAALLRQTNWWAVYLDGNATPELETTYAFDPGPGLLYIASHVGDRTWDGALDDVRVYDRALSLAEIQALADHPHVDIWTAVEIGWQSVSGVVYQVQWTTNLPDTNAWADLGGTVTGNGGTSSVFDSTRAKEEAEYRVVVPWGE